MILKRIVLSIFLCLPVYVSAQTDTSTSSGALEVITPLSLIATPNTSSTGIFNLLDKRTAEQLKISETQASIDYEGEIQKVSQGQLDELIRLEQESQKLSTLFTLSESGSLFIPEAAITRFTVFFSDYKKFFPEQEKLEETPAIFDQNFAFLNSSLESKKQEIQGIVKESKIKESTQIQQLEELENQLEKTQLSIQLQLFDGLKKAASFLAFILVTFLLSRFASNFVQKKSHSPEEKKKVISSLIYLLRNIIIIAIVIVFFFSELLNFLPFLAILGTAIGFALRDVISSFIAWFVIGLKDTTYKLGDVIEIPRDGIFGEVVKIHPLVTTIKELGLSGPNSKFRTFPNKLIFETSLNNLWKYGGWTFISVECMITYGSDIELARTLLFDSMNEVISSPDFTHAIDVKARLKKLGIPEKNQVPQVFVDVKTQGIFMRGKILVMWNERHEIRNRTVIQFAKRVKDTPSVELRYVDSWGIEGK